MGYFMTRRMSTPSVSESRLCRDTNGDLMLNRLAGSIVGFKRFRKHMRESHLVTTGCS
jgi:hypothetical protein